MTTTTNDIKREALERALRVMEESRFLRIPVRRDTTDTVDPGLHVKRVIAAALLRERADEADHFFRQARAAKFRYIDEFQMERAAELRAAADELERGE